MDVDIYSIFVLLLFLEIGVPIPVAARSKAWVCGRSLAGIVGSNLAGGVDVCREYCVLSGRGEVSASG